MVHGRGIIPNSTVQPMDHIPVCLVMDVGLRPGQSLNHYDYIITTLHIIYYHSTYFAYNSEPVGSLNLHGELTAGGSRDGSNIDIYNTFNQLS